MRRAAALLRERLLEGLHEVNDLNFRSLLGRLRDVLAVHLVLNELELPVAHFVCVLGGVELVARALLDELDGELDLVLFRRQVRDGHLVERFQLVCVVQLFERQPVAQRAHQLERPDWCVLDLDPKDAPFRDVVRVARALRALCDEIALPHYVKTTGSTGLHVLIPLGRQLTYEQCRTFANLLAKVVAARVPEIATLERVISQREGKVYLDWLQNRRGQLIVAPFSVRPVPGARVSAPLFWRDVTARLSLDRYTITTVPARMKKLKEDPMRGVLEDKPDLVAALENLQDRLDSKRRAARGKR